VAISPAQMELAQTLFEGAIQRAEKDRIAYLEETCPEDPQLREDVLRMAASHEKDTEFLETPLLHQLLNLPMLEQGDLVKGRFMILQRLGKGGMSEVYEAVDTAHADHPERVALKTIRRDLAGLAEAAARLRREVQLVHQIAHPNVCKVHQFDTDSRPEGQLLFLTMDLLEGETLHQRLKRAGPLAIADALEYAGQIASGLDAAHKEGVIHRDLTSNNIMLVPRKDGTTRAVILDFGIACGEEDEFRRGTGTAAYMAPERIGDAGATRPADIYSFGVVLYEMVTGQLPFAPETPAGQRRKPPPAPSAIRRRLPRRWDRAILRCLDPNPKRRFSTAADAIEALQPVEWPLLVAASFLVVLALVVTPPIPPIFVKPAQAVAMLPFDGAEGPQSGLLDYLADQIQKNPVIRRKWVVFSPAEARQAGVGTAAQAKAVFGADYVVAGMMIPEGDSVSITGQLLQTGHSRSVGSFQKTCPLDNAVCLQGGMLEEISNIFVPKSSSSVTTPHISEKALPYFLQGLQYLRRNSVSYSLAIPFFQQAIASNPSAPQPRVALADAYILRFGEVRDKAILDQAQKILGEVLTSYPGLPDAHASLGALFRLEGRYEEAVRELTLALQADPSNHLFHLRLAQGYDALGRDAEAVAEFKHVLELQPRYWEGYSDFALFNYRRGRLAEAADLFEQLIQWAPDHAQGLANLGGAYVDMGRNADAERVSRRSCAITPARRCYVNLGIALQRQRRMQEAIEADNRALTFGTPSVIQLLNLADAHAYLAEQGSPGEKQEAEAFFHRTVARAQDELKVNLRDSGTRAMLAYCLSQVGEREAALFELEQALQSSPQDKSVQKYGILTYESLGLRNKALEILRGVNRQVLQELELARGAAALRKDPAYPEIARKIRN
jgi:eukaryotic-like serine/threonine-protein kinase